MSIRHQIAKSKSCLSHDVDEIIPTYFCVDLLPKIRVDPASHLSIWRYVRGRLCVGMIVTLIIIISLTLCSRSVSFNIAQHRTNLHSRKIMVVSKFKAAVNSDEGVPPPQEGVEFAKLPWNLNLPDQHYYVHLTTDPESGWTLEHYDPKTDGGILTDVTDGEYKSLKHYGQSPLPLFPSTTSLK